MRLHAADAFILGTYALRETDRIVSFLTRDNGKKRGVARGARPREERVRGRRSSR
jgi:DNA repair protein RecO (recombination protein O)